MSGNVTMEIRDGAVTLLEASPGIRVEVRDYDVDALLVPAPEDAIRVDEAGERFHESVVVGA